jgi:hypothetical protein
MLSSTDLGPKVRPEISLTPVPGGMLAEIPECTSDPSRECNPAKMPKGYCVGCADRVKPKNPK